MKINSIQFKHAELAKKYIDKRISMNNLYELLKKTPEEKELFKQFDEEYNSILQLFLNDVEGRECLKNSEYSEYIDIIFGEQAVKSHYYELNDLKKEEIYAEKYLKQDLKRMEEKYDVKFELKKDTLKYKGRNYKNALQALNEIQFNKLFTQQFTIDFEHRKPKNKSSKHEWNYINENDIKDLGDALNRVGWPEGLLIDLGSSLIGDDWANIIADALMNRKEPCIRKLSINLSYNNLGAQSAKAFAELIASENCPPKFSLELYKNSIGHEGVNYFAKAFSSEHSVQGLTLGLKENELDSNDAITLFKALENYRKKGLSLDLSANKDIKVEAYEVLAELFSSEACPEELSIDLNFNEMGPNGGAEVLAEGLSSSPMKKLRLDLYCNELTNKDLNAFSKVLASKNRPQEFFLLFHEYYNLNPNYNPVFDALYENGPQKLSLFIGDEYFCDQHLEKLSKILPYNQSLVELNLNKRKFKEEETYSTLAKMLKYNHSLTKLDIDYPEEKIEYDSGEEIDVDEKKDSINKKIIIQSLLKRNQEFKKMDTNNCLFFKFNPTSLENELLKDKDIRFIYK